MIRYTAHITRRQTRRHRKFQSAMKTGAHPRAALPRDGTRRNATAADRNATGGFVAGVLAI
jgi:hypothetical protein